MLDMIRQQSKWGLVSYSGHTTNLFQSLGNIFFPINYLLTPAYFIPSVIGAEFNKILAYTIFAVEIYACIYLFCINLNFRIPVAILAGWLFILGAFPLLGVSPIYGIFSLIPHWSTGAATTLLTMLCISKLGHTRISSLLLSIGIILLLIHTMVANAAWMMLSVPILSFFTLSSFFLLDTKPKRILFVVSLLFVLATLLVLGFFNYFLGLFVYTAAIFFPNDLINVRADWQNASIAIWHNAVGTYVFFVAVLGAAFDLFSKTKPKRYLSIVFLSFVSLLFLASYIVIKYFPTWQGPVPLYFEMPIWPLYAIYCANFFISICVGITKIKYLKFLTFLEKYNVVNISLTGLITITLLFFVYPVNNNDSMDSYKYPPSSTPITKILNDNIGIATNRQFRGRVATFTGQNLEKANWFDLHSIDNKLNQTYGNDLRLLGFSYFDIPTLFEYSQYITPAFYMVTKKFLSNPADQQMRNVMTLRKPNSKILSLLGVRYFLTDAEVNIDAKLVYQAPYAPIFLYELDNVNTGQYSPTKALFIQNANLSLEKMSDPAFDPNTTVIVNQMVLQELVPATDCNIEFDKGGNLKISAKSQDYSLLVLPIEYSHCLEVVTNNTKSDVVLLRTNLLQTGVIFKNDLDIVLKYFTGLGHNSSCRLEDWKEAKRLEFVDGIDG